MTLVLLALHSTSSATGILSASMGYVIEVLPVLPL